MSPNLMSPLGFCFSRFTSTSSVGHCSSSSITRSEGRQQMAASHKVAHAGYRGPSVVKEIVYGIALGISAGLLWKMHHWNNQRRTKEFYDLLERGEISVVVEDE